MRAAFVAVAVVVLAAAAYWFRGQRVEQREPSADGTALLRQQVLSREILKQAGPAPGIRCVVYDRHVGNGIATLVSFDDGTTSLYLSSGGGVIGAGAHDPVRRAAQLFREEAARVAGSFQPTGDEYPLPADGRAVFYVITDSATLTSGPLLSSELVSGKHPLAALARRAQDVITEIRKAT
jgi:hypothetical protein